MAMPELRKSNIFGRVTSLRLNEVLQPSLRAISSRVASPKGYPWLQHDAAGRFPPIDGLFDRGKHPPLRRERRDHLDELALHPQGRSPDTWSSNCLMQSVQRAFPA